MINILFSFSLITGILKNTKIINIIADNRPTQAALIAESIITIRYSKIEGYMKIFKFFLLINEEKDNKKYKR